MMRLVRMLSGLLCAAFGRRTAAAEPVRRLCAVEVKTSGQPTQRLRVVETGFDLRERLAEGSPLADDGTAIARHRMLNGLRRLFRGRGINVRSDAQLLAAVEDVCRELDAIRAQVGEQLLRDMGLADCGTPGSDDAPGWAGRDDDDD